LPLFLLKTTILHAVFFALFFIFQRALHHHHHQFQAPRCWRHRDVTQISFGQRQNPNHSFSQSTMASVQESTSIPESALPLRKRKAPEDAAAAVIAAVLNADVPKPTTAKRPATVTKAREIRLEQNRKAARESRRRKKVMIEELQRSVIFFSRANGTLKQQNDELTRLLMQAQAQVTAIESGGKVPASPVAAPVAAEKEPTVGAPAPQPTSAAAAAMAGTLPPMQPGATMQAMANFQQAAAAAMQVAVQGMKGIPGVDMQILTSPASVAGNSQQAYNDTMTALAMQKAAAAAAGSIAVDPAATKAETEV
jgi:hypothetical protein